MEEEDIDWLVLVEDNEMLVVGWCWMVVLAERSRGQLMTMTMLMLE